MTNSKIIKKDKKNILKIIWIILGILIHLFNLILFIGVINIPKLDDGGVGGFALALAIGYLLTWGLGALILYWFMTLLFFLYKKYIKRKKENVN